MSKEKRDYIDSIKSMSNRALFDEMVEKQFPDDFNGDFTPMGAFQKEQTLVEVEERLKDWLEK